MKLILVILFIPISISESFLPQIIFWNTGQGLWITALREKECFHFDMGGEFYNARKVRAACSTRKNIGYFSHWDWDHIGFAKKLKNFNFCIALLPSGETKESRRRFLESLPHCQKTFSVVRKLKSHGTHAKVENDRSHILIYDRKILLPGDSTRRMEKYWSKNVPRVKILAVGHHGSKTSSSKYLLDTIQPYLAIVSARKKIYGHPHPTIEKRFKKYRIPLIKTEDWGNIRIIIKNRLSF